MLNPLGLSGEPLHADHANYTNQKSGTPHCVECRTLLEKAAATYSPAGRSTMARTGLTSLFGMGRGGAPSL